MTRLERAMRAANERKMAGTGNDPEDTDPQVVNATAAQDRAVFSGWDIGYEELAGTSQAIADFYATAAHQMGLDPLFISCWCDGLLTGLLLASLPPTDEDGATDDIILGGEDK